MRWVAVLLFFAAVGLAFQAPAIDASIARYEPFPAKAGQVVDIWIKVENKGSTARNVTVGIAEQFPYRYVSDPVNIGILPSYQAYYVKQRIYIPGSAPQGEMKVRIWHSSSGVRVEKEETILVENRPKFLVEVEGEAETGKIKPINITISPLLSGADNVVVSLAGDFIVIGPSRKFVGSIRKGEERAVEFLIKPKQSMDAGTFLVSISYEYGNSATGNETITVGLPVRDIPEVVASLKSAEDGIAEIEVVNRGHGTARFLTLECNGMPEVSYIGDLMPDDFDSVRVKADGLLRCRIKYEDSEGAKEKEVEFEVPAKKGFPVLLPLLAVTALAFWWLRR